MLSSRTSSSETTAPASVRIKSLYNAHSLDEQKDLEHEFEAEEESTNNVDEVESMAALEEQVTYSGMSSRATDIKNYLQDHSEVKAILLKHDGSAQEISYNASSSGTRKLLSGRPSIVGEIEELQLVVVQTLDILSPDSLNQHTLPVPLCHTQSHGDYVLLRMDSTATPVDVTLAEYEKYVNDNKELTATSLKERTIDHSVPLRLPSSCKAISDASMERLRGALETQIWAEFDDINAAKQTDADIQKAVKLGIQQFVDNAVSAFSVSPMEDPDYKPEDDIEAEQEEEGTEGSDGELDSFSMDIDNRPWREQLMDALDHVQEIGRMDGAAFAQKISATFYELGNAAPALEDMVSLYDRIKNEFANEAEEELEDGEQSEVESESESVAVSEIESAVESEEEIESEEEVENEDWEEALEHVRNIGRKDGDVLAQDLCDLFYDEYGAEPSLEELHGLWLGIQEELAQEAEEESDDSGDDEKDYDPDNRDDQFLANLDAVEDQQYEIRLFAEADESNDSIDSGDESEDQEMAEALDHVRSVAKEDGAVLAQDLCDLFQEEHGAEPTLEQLNGIWQGIQDELAQEALEEAEEESGDYSDDDEGTEYDPDNLTDRLLAQHDATRDRLYETRIFGDDDVVFESEDGSIDESVDQSVDESVTESVDESLDETVDESEEESQDESVDEEWEDALEHIRGVGRMDGHALASNMFDILCNVKESPSLEEFANIWHGIEDGLGLEAQEETADSGESEDSEERDDNMLTLGFSAKTVASHWVSRATNLYLDQKGREPTEEELLDTIRAFASDLADTVIATYGDSEVSESEEVDSESADSEDTVDFAESVDDSVDESVAESVDESEEYYESEEESEDGEYDPDNSMDHVLARWDLEADIKHQRECYDQMILNTPIVTGKSGSGVSWNVYFNEDELSQQAEHENLQKAIDIFSSRNQRVPTILDLKQMAVFLAVPNEALDEEETASAIQQTEQLAPTTVLVSPVKEKKAAQSFNVYLEDSKLSQKESEQIAIKWFNRFNGRDPSQEETEQIHAFIQKEADLKEEEFMVPVRASLSFNDEESEGAQEEDEEEAIKWFERFNNRKPDDEESERIKQFVRVDDDEMVDIE